MASKARLDVTEQNLASVEPSKMPAPPVWTFYIGVSGDMAARIIAAPREARAYILDLFEHREMGNLVRKHPGESLEVKLSTIWTDEKQSREEAERRERLEEIRVEEKE